jgi:hypothetical protein
MTMPASASRCWRWILWYVLEAREIKRPVSGFSQTPGCSSTSTESILVQNDSKACQFVKNETKLDLKIMLSNFLIYTQKIHKLKN